MNIGGYIKEMRIDRRVSQGDMAGYLDIGQPHLSQIENGHKKPSLDLLIKVADYFRVPLPVLFWGGITENDVQESKKEAFRTLKPTVDKMIQTIFE